jgi:hypothetical protein
MAPIPITAIHRATRPALRRGRRTMTLGFLFLFFLILLFFFFSLSLLYCLGCNLPFPLNYKRGSRVSRRGDD